MKTLQIKHSLFISVLMLMSTATLCFSMKDALGFLKSATYNGFNAVKCQFTICCNEEWIISNLEGLEKDLKNKVHGQHLVHKTVIGHIRGHLRTPEPLKSLVLSFHGPTGVGKNFVSQIIAENLYKGGLHSEFVHFISATKEFPHKGMDHNYEDKLKMWIEGNVSRCGQSMFIFDEIDKMPPLLLDAIKPYLDYYPLLGGVDYRRTIFIFLSNTGSTTISTLMLKHWRQGKKREQFQLREVENDIMMSAINDGNKNGLWHTKVISSHLVTAFIPFLPLERAHIRLCIGDILIAHKYYRHRDTITTAVFDRVIEELMFTPEEERIFSSTGCKRVSEKVDFVMMTTMKDEL